MKRHPGNGIEGAMVCTSLGSLLRPLFYLLGDISYPQSVDNIYGIYPKITEIPAGGFQPGVDVLVVLLQDLQPLLDAHASPKWDWEDSSVRSGMSQ